MDHRTQTSSATSKVYTHAHTHTCTHTHMQTHTHTHTQTCTHAHMQTHTHTHTHTNMHARTHVNIHTHTHAHKHTHGVHVSCGGLVVWLQRRVQSHSIVKCLIMGNRWKWGCLYCGRCPPSCDSLLIICSKYTALHHLW